MKKEIRKYRRLKKGKIRKDGDYKRRYWKIVIEWREGGEDILGLDKDYGELDERLR